MKAKLPLPTYTKGRGDKKKTNLLSLNVYIHLHPFAKGKCKEEYYQVVEEFVTSLPKYKTITPQYKIYFKNKRKKDLDNYTFPMHKFLMDAIVKAGVITDDDYDYVPKIVTEFGGIKDDNYVEVKIIGELDGIE